jgi:toxin ParE1/3/4
MKIFWTDFASECLKEAYCYHKIAAGEKIARNLRKKIFKSTFQLSSHPFSGQIEMTLQHLGENHRYIISGNYKIVYRLVDETVLITDLFDSRQDPQKINNTQRSSHR